MREIGGKSFSQDMRAKVAAVRQRMDELKLRGAGAMTEFVSEADLAEQGIKAIEQETLELRQLNNDLHGNNPPPESPPNGKGEP